MMEDAAYIEAVELFHQWNLHISRAYRELDLVVATHARLMTKAKTHEMVRRMVNSVLANGRFYPVVSSLRSLSYEHSLDTINMSADRYADESMDVNVQKEWEAR